MERMDFSNKPEKMTMLVMYFTTRVMVVVQFDTQIVGEIVEMLIVAFDQQGVYYFRADQP